VKAIYFACGAAAIVALGLVGLFEKGLNSGQKMSSVNQVSPAPLAPRAAANDTNAAPADRWSYREEDDKMRGTKNYYASVNSENELSFDFPYDGGSRGQLMLSDENGAFGVYLTISKGQIDCNPDAYPDQISIKVDDESVRGLSCWPSDDGKTDRVLLGRLGGDEFLTEIRRSHKIIIEASFYQAGRKQLTFRTDGLQWYLASDGTIR
jgi:hypothetical protein